MARRQLTRNDAIFVLVATVSPASLYLWIMVLIAVFNKGILPGYLGREAMSKGQQRLLILFSIGSFLLWLVVAGLALWPSHSDHFSQPACDQVYELLTLLWSAVFLAGFFVAVAVVSVIPRCQRKHMARRGAPSDL
jgi:uncharacterized membrane protein